MVTSLKCVRAELQCLAADLNVVVFNVQNRLAPETKCPNNIKDFYEVVKYVSRNAMEVFQYVIHGMYCEFN